MSTQIVNAGQAALLALAPFIILWWATFAAPWKWRRRVRFGHQPQPSDLSKYAVMMTKATAAQPK